MNEPNLAEALTAIIKPIVKDIQPVQGQGRLPRGKMTRR
jgi:hypothetical protein